MRCVKVMSIDDPVVMAALVDKIGRSEEVEVNVDSNAQALLSISASPVVPGLRVGRDSMAWTLQLRLPSSAWVSSGTRASRALWSHSLLHRWHFHPIRGRRRLCRFHRGSAGNFLVTSARSVILVIGP